MIVKNLKLVFHPSNESPSGNKLLNLLAQFSLNVVKKKPQELQKQLQC